MNRWSALLWLCVIVLTGCDAPPEAALRRYVSAHEQPLRTLAEEWLREGPLTMAHDDRKVPLFGDDGPQSVPDVWWIVPRDKDLRAATYRGLWVWRAEETGWWIQSPLNVVDGGRGHLTYLAPVRALSLAEAEKRSNIPEGRLARWMDLVREIDIRTIGLDDAPGSPSVRIEFQDAELKPVFYMPVGGGRRFPFGALGGPWYWAAPKPPAGSSSPL